MTLYDFNDIDVRLDGAPSSAPRPTVFDVISASTPSFKVRGSFFVRRQEVTHVF